MKIALIGASGFTGTSILKEALQRGYTVTAIARDTQKITVEDEKLTKVALDVYDLDKLTEALRGHDAVVSAFNAGWTNPNLYNDFIKGGETIQQATKQAGVKRYIFIGGAGSLEIQPGLQLVDSPNFPAEWKAGATAARDYLNILKKENELNWTFLSPAIDLHPGERTGKYRTGTDQPVFDEHHKSAITADDLAVALLDELEKNQFVKRRFTIGY
ncbi:NAD(P)-dependent oxidoreductase [Mucilaginibacter sp. KACC 22063]|uniref:NAD(P)-dependent oxidoreductase n=1 Tax=Mucilaginibacter sp. KACC 22063 TaxID=3025666 RepID=UPI0023651789|nr:NAD(P)-dependent oxidoreductase [Mucilaginibacter sp. KACC 22063]WDF56974.1 NAD(P)-dependent oxidoreductase [Mucilaginibacter sp. KACC 22063]